MPSMTDTPKSDTKPMADEMLKSNPVKYNASTPPLTANGMPTRAKKLSRSELNSQ